MVEPYYQDDTVMLFHGDCREITEWLKAAVLVTDPPYGRNWRQGRLNRITSDAHSGIVGDRTTEARDAALQLWGDRPAIVFGDLMLPPPPNTKLVGVYKKPADAGMRGAIGGWRRDLEAFYFVGPWPSGIGGQSSLLTTRVALVGSPHGVAGRTGHPHTKPLDVMQELILRTPEGVVADPFAGSGSTLVAAKMLGRRAIGVEVEERYCEIAARRLSQDVLPLGVQS